MLVVDTNIIISALIKDSEVRKLLTHTYETLISPEIVYKEIEEHKEELLQKSKLSEDDLENTLFILSKHIITIKNSKILPFVEEAEKIIAHIDKDDVPIVATSLAHNSCPIWTDDKDFRKQNKIRIITTKELIDAEISSNS
ncbi:MAG: PIN domain-containing protein [Nanoarchaeota archaeon]